MRSLQFRCELFDCREIADVQHVARTARGGGDLIRGILVEVDHRDTPAPRRHQFCAGGADAIATADHNAEFGVMAGGRYSVAHCGSSPIFFTSLAYLAKSLRM